MVIALQVELARLQVLLLFCQVAACQVSLEHRNVASLLCQRRIFIGHFEVTPRKEEGLLLLQAAPIVGYPSTDHRIAVVNRLQIVLHRCRNGGELPAAAQLPQDVHGGTHQHGQSYQTQCDGCNQCRRDAFLFRGVEVLTVITHEAYRTLADWAGEVDITSAAIVAGELVTGVSVFGAVIAGEAQGAPAGEVVDAVHACAGVEARTAGAVIDVGLATGARETERTAARDLVHEVQTLSTCREQREGVSSGGTPSSTRPRQRQSNHRSSRWKEARMMSTEAPTRGSSKGIHCCSKQSG